MKKLLLSALFATSIVYTNAQQVRPAASAQIYHEIAQLQHLTNVLYFAAHPDDENTRLLAYLVNDRHLRTAYLSLTRGDGGQNILGSEQGAALGLIRTHELMEARKLDGAEQFFTRAIDFGFSKNYDETFKHWDEKLITGDAAWVIRKYRPDVIICRFPPNEMAGHGQHAASAIIAAKAFKAAADANAYPEQLTTYKTWQAKRILLNTYRFGSRNTTSEDQFKLSVGQYEPLLGMGVGELAGISRSIHRSQGAGTPSTPGVQTEYFKLVDGEDLKESLFDGIDITWNRVNRKDIGDDIARILNTYDFTQPEKSLPALLAVRKKVETVNDAFWRDQKMQELDAIILHAAGVMAELYTSQPEATAGSTLPFTLKVVARANQPLTLERLAGQGKDTVANIMVAKDSLITLQTNITIPVGTAITEPYWLSTPAKDAAHYSILDQKLSGYPEAPNTLVAIITLKLGDTKFQVPVPLSYKHLDPTHGDVVEALRIVPDVTINFATDLLIANADGTAIASVHIHSYKDVNNGTLSITGAGADTRVEHINLKSGVDTLISVTLKPKSQSGTIEAAFETGGRSYNKSQHIIRYEHLPTLQYFTPATASLLQASWKSAAKKIGYINGAGDKVAEVLRLAGLQVDILKDGDINEEKLKKYDAVLTGIRAVNTEKKMEYWLPVLLRYVKNGGTLVMQYNTLQEMATKDLGPYLITLSSLRVTEEDATVNFIDPNNKILNRPNKITANDFENWVQERGLYFATKWDDKYQPLFEMHDTNEEVLKGSTLYTPYGKGQYIYTSLSFSRQLPAGNIGAIKLLLNMLSVGKP